MQVGEGAPCLPGDLGYGHACEHAYVCVYVCIYIWGWKVAVLTSTLHPLHSALCDCLFVHLINALKLMLWVIMFVAVGTQCGQT